MPAAPDDAPFTDDDLDALFSTFADQPHPGCVLAVSGGSDSLAMLHLARRWRDHRRARGLPAVPLLVATVDHGLRPASAAEAVHVADVATGWGFEHVILRWGGEKPATGLQEAAREARYGLLVDLAKGRGLPRIATAHTVDDLAETFLMRLSRGSGLEGLAGVMLGARRGTVAVIRPLLAVSRARLRAELTRADIAWMDDPSNEDERFTRVRWRRLMPLLAAEGLDAARILDVSLKLRQANTALDATVGRHMADHVLVEHAGSAEVWRPFDPLRDAPGADPAPTRFRIAMGDPWNPQPFEIDRRVMALAVRVLGADPHGPGSGQLETLLDDIYGAARAGKTLRRTLGGCLVTYEQGLITIAPEPPRRGRKTTQTA